MALTEGHRGRHRHAGRALVRHRRGRPWRERGRDLGYPTANIRLDNILRAQHGIYAVGRGGAERFDGVASYGRRPTFDNGAPLLEVFLFDFKGDLYGSVLDVAFIGFIRDELKFDGIEALIRQMNDDSAKARAALAAAPGAFPKLGAIG
jgi:riboflavin kinase/FMN adenylyltransferase